MLLNPSSGGNDRGLDARQVCAMATDAFRKVGRDLEARIVKPSGLDGALQAAVNARPSAVIVAGGDGTVSAAARHLGGTGIPLGILPMGTFNLAARDLGVPLEIEQAVDFLTGAVNRSIDVLDVAGHSCLCTTILGFYPEFARIYERRDHGGHWWKKAWRLITSLPRTFAESRPLALEWRADDGEGRTRSRFSAIVPGRYQASAGLMPERTDFACGKMTAYIGSQSTAGAAMRGMIDYAFGRQDENPELAIFQTGDLEIRVRGRRHLAVMIDGEILRLPLPLRFSIRPRHLEVLTSAEHMNGGA